MKPTTWEVEDIERARAYAASGKRIADIYSDLFPNRGHCAVKAMCRRYGIRTIKNELPPNLKVLTDEQQAYIRSVWDDERVSTKTIAHELKLHTTTLYTKAKEMGLPRREINHQKIRGMKLASKADRLVLDITNAYDIVVRGGKAKEIRDVLSKRGRPKAFINGCIRHVKRCRKQFLKEWERDPRISPPSVKGLLV